MINQRAATELIYRDFLEKNPKNYCLHSTIRGIPRDIRGIPGEQRKTQEFPVISARELPREWGNENGEYTGYSPIFGKSGNSLQKLRSPGTGNMQRSPKPHYQHLWL